MNSLVISERIETTVPRAKELRRLADRLITLGKRETLHARRRVFSLLSNKAATDKIFTSLAGRFAGREGGYTRIMRTGYRPGDGAEMAILEYLPAEEKKAASKGKKKAPRRRHRRKPRRPKRLPRGPERNARGQPGRRRRKAGPPGAPEEEGGTEEK